MMTRTARCKAIVIATGQRCRKAASDDWGVVCAWHKNQWIAIEMRNVSNVSRHRSWKRSAARTFPDRTPLRGMSGNVETSPMGPTTTNVSRRGDQSRQAPTAGPGLPGKDRPGAGNLES